MIVLLATVVVVCVGIVLVAVGRGGQIAEFAHDAPPLELPARRPIAGTDVALLRLPAGPWGYSFRATDDALRRIAHALTERDTRIAILEQQVSELRSVRPAPDRTGQGEADPGSPWFDRSASFAGRRSPASHRTGQPAALGTPLADGGLTDEAPAEADDRPEGDVPHDAAPPADAPAEGAAQGGARADDAGPAVTAPAWVQQKAWTPDAAWPQKGAEPKPAEPEVDGAFENDDEPASATAPEPASETDSDSDSESAASSLGFSPPAPWPGDRLVASSRPSVEAEYTGGEQAEGTADTAVDDDAVDDAPETEADDTDSTRTDDEADASADEPGTPAAAAEPRGEGH